MSPRTRWRRLRMGALTLLGRPEGFFAPYRYAAGVAPTGYPEIEEVFRAAEPRMEATLARIESHAPRLAGLAGPPPTPRWDQSWFPRLDGAAAYAILRDAVPAQVVEVGSGHSTRMLAQALTDAGGSGRITAIDPAPRADIARVVHRHVARTLAAEDIALFRALGAGDVAFFDSSHLLWPGTDVDLILNRILPALAPGVLIHIHDVTLPDAYPEAWGWRGYTEALGLGGWLAGGGCRILWSSHYAATRMGAADRPAVRALPIPSGALETSLWLERV